MIGLLLSLALIGVVAWLLITYVPMPAPIKTVIIVVAVVMCVLIAMRAFGIGLPSDVSVPRVRSFIPLL